MVKAVILDVSEAELSRRAKLGLDRRDEMWEGVLHMAPAPTNEHQRLVDELVVYLVPLLKSKNRGTLRSGINVFNEKAPKQDYRIPDHTFVAAGREGIIVPDGIRGGAPDAVIEIRSPDDETYEKFPFFAALGVREIIVIDRDTKKPEVFRLTGPQYLVVSADKEAWIPSEALSVRFRLTAGTPPKLALQDVEDPSCQAEI